MPPGVILPRQVDSEPELKKSMALATFGFRSNSMLSSTERDLLWTGRLTVKGARVVAIWYLEDCLQNRVQCKLLKEKLGNCSVMAEGFSFPGTERDFQTWWALGKGISPSVGFRHQLGDKKDWNCGPGEIVHVAMC